MALSSSAAKARLLEDGNDKIDKVILGDLAFWLSHTKNNLRDGIQFVRTFEALVELPIIAENGCILTIVITIIRKNCVSGERMINVTLKVKIDAQERVIRIYYAKEDARKSL